MSIWTSTKSKYGTYPANSNSVSKSTAYRWLKENRSKKRQSITMKNHSTAIAGQ